VYDSAVHVHKVVVSTTPPSTTDSLFIAFVAAASTTSLVDDCVLTTLSVITSPLSRIISKDPHDLPIFRLDAAIIGLTLATCFFGPHAGLATLSTTGSMLN
jgi:hypothetical protein